MLQERTLKLLPPWGWRAEDVRRMWAEVPRLRETLPAGGRVASQVRTWALVLLIWLTPSPRLGGLKEVASPL